MSEHLTAIARPGRVIGVGTVGGALVAGLLYWFGAVRGRPLEPWDAILLPYWCFVGLVIGALSATLLWAALRVRPVGDGARFRLAFASALVVWLAAYPVTMLAQSEYAPIAVTVLPSIVWGGLTAITLGLLDRRTPPGGSVRDVGGIVRRPDVGLLRARWALLPIACGLAAVAALGVVVGWLIPVRLAGRALPELLPTLAPAESTDLWSRFALVGGWLVVCSLLTIVLVVGHHVTRRSQVVAISLFVGGLTLAHTWWLSVGVSSVLFWRDPSFSGQADPNPFSELLWTLETCAWVSILVGCAITAKRLLRPNATGRAPTD